MNKKKRQHIFEQQESRFFRNKAEPREIPTYLESTICMRCGALYKKGLWTWNDIPEHTHEAICPACQRIIDRYPAGIIELGGSFFREYRAEIFNLCRYVERTEIKEHPLERIMQFSEQDDKVLITTTGAHLARRIGDALENSCQGLLEYAYEAENFVRIIWQR